MGKARLEAGGREVKMLISLFLFPSLDGRDEREGDKFAVY